MESGIAFSLTIAMLMAYYKRTSQYYSKIIPISGIVIGFIVAIVSAILRSIPNFINRTSLSFWSMVPVVVSLILFLILMGLKNLFKNKKTNLYNLLYDLTFLVYVISSFFYYLPALFVQLNTFVYYGESTISTMVLYRIIGYFIAVMVICLSALSIYKNLMKLKSKEIGKVVFSILFVGGLTQFVIVLQRLYSLSIIPRKAWIFNLIAGVRNNEHYVVFIILFILIFMPISLFKENVKVDEPYQNSAELRKIKFKMLKSRRWAKLFILLIFINFLSLSVLKIYAGREVALSEPEEYQMEDGLITIPLTSLDDGHLHRYLYKAEDGIQVRFFAIKKAENSYAAVLDACEICGPSGYFERNDDVVCKLCDVVMNRGTIGFKGGCNPIPFPYLVHDGNIKILTKDLDSMSYVFK